MVILGLGTQAIIWRTLDTDLMLCFTVFMIWAAWNICTSQYAIIGGVKNIANAENMRGASCFTCPVPSLPLVWAWPTNIRPVGLNNTLEIKTFVACADSDQCWEHGDCHHQDHHNITHQAQVVPPGVDNDPAAKDAVDAVEAEPGVHHVYAGHPRHVRLDVAQVAHVPRLVTRGPVTHLKSTFVYKIVLFKFTWSGLKWPFIDLQPLVMSPSWWMWKPWRPGARPSILPRTFTWPVGPPVWIIILWL